MKDFVHERIRYRYRCNVCGFFILLDDADDKLTCPRCDGPTKLVGFSGVLEPTKRKDLINGYA